MTNEQIEPGPSTIVSMPEHMPNPKLETIPNPSGDGLLALVQTGEDGWEIKEIDGSRENVARHTFKTIRSFVRWVTRWSTNPQAVHILADVPNSFKDRMGSAPRRELIARLDPRDPVGDLVSCVIPLDPTFGAWVEAMNAPPMNQREAFAFFRSFGHAIASESAVAELLGAIAAVQVTAASSLETKLAPNGRVVVAGQAADVQVSEEVPAELKLNVSIYDGVAYEDGGRAIYSVRVVLEVDSGLGGLTIGLSMPELPSTLLEANDDLAEHVERNLGEGFLVGVGREVGHLVPEWNADPPGRTSDPRTFERERESES